MRDGRRSPRRCSYAPITRAGRRWPPRGWTNKRPGSSRMASYARIMSKTARRPTCARTAVPARGTVIERSPPVTDLPAVAGSALPRTGGRRTDARVSIIPVGPPSCTRRPLSRPCRGGPDVRSGRPGGSRQIQIRFVCRPGQRNSSRARRGLRPTRLPGPCPAATAAVDEQAIDRIRDRVQGRPHDRQAAERLPLLVGIEEHLEYHAPPVRMPRPVADPVGQRCLDEGRVMLFLPPEGRTERSTSWPGSFQRHDSGGPADGRHPLRRGARLPAAGTGPLPARKCLANAGRGVRARRRVAARLAPPAAAPDRGRLLRPDRGPGLGRGGDRLPAQRRGALPGGAGGRAHGGRLGPGQRRRLRAGHRPGIPVGRLGRRPSGAAGRANRRRRAGRGGLVPGHRPAGHAV
jgi:hypothetical protein